MGIGIRETDSDMGSEFTDGTGKGSEIVSGIFVALTTPMNADETINSRCLDAKIKKLRHAGIRRIFCLGTNGEFYALGLEEKKQFLASVREIAPPDTILSAGVGAVTTEEAISMVKAASSYGYQLAAAITPYFLQLSENQLERHYLRIADSSDIPVLLYNIPSRTGITISSQLAARLCGHPRIVGIKDSSGDLKSVKAFIELQGPSFSVFSGTDSLILDALVAGSVGAVSGMANIVPYLVQSIYDTFRKGEHEKASRAQERLTSLRTLFEHGYSVSVIKLAENLMGYGTGPGRAPANIYDVAVTRKVASILGEFSLLRDSAAVGK